MTIKEALEMIQTLFDRPRLWLIVWVSGALILLLSDAFGFSSIVDPSRGWIGMLTLVGCVAWIVTANPWSVIIRLWNKHNERARIYQQLKLLSKDERLRLAYCLDRKQDLIVGNNDIAASTLASKGLLIQTTYGLLRSTYAVSPQAREQLQKHESILFPEAFWQDPEVKRAFDQFDSNQEDPFAGPDFS